MKNVKLTPNQFVELKHLKTGQKRRGYIQSYTSETITLTIKLKAPDWEIISEGLNKKGAQ